MHLAEVAGITDDAIVEAGTDGDQDIAVLHRHVGFEGAVHAEHAEEQGVGRRKGAQPHQRAGQRILEQAAETRQLGRGIGKYRAAAEIDHRPLGVEEQIDRLLDLPEMPLDDRVVRTHLDRLRIAVEGAAGAGDVLRDVDDDRAGATGAGNVEGLLHRRRQVAHVLDQEVVLDAGPRDADRIALLEGVLADGVGRHLAGDDDQRNRIHVRRGDAGHGVGNARPGSDQADADPVRRTRIGVGRMDGSLLVTDQNVLDLVLL